MGDIAVVRQSFFDTEHYAQDQADYKRRPRGRSRPDYNVSLEALAPAADKKIPVVFEPRDALMVFHAQRHDGHLSGSPVWLPARARCTIRKGKIGVTIG